jgi:hypothetical protein
MASYTGSLRIAETNDVVEARFDVEGDELSLSTGGEHLGTWRLGDIQIDDTGTEIYLALNGEEVIVNLRDRDAFMAAIRPPKKTRVRQAKPAREKRPRPDVVEVVRSLFDGARWRAWLSDRLVRWVIASVAVIIVALLALFATGSLGMILVLLGMVALVVAALAVSEDLSAVSWVPGFMSETTLVLVGGGLMLIGAVLIFIG